MYKLIQASSMKAKLSDYESVEEYENDLKKMRWGRFQLWCKKQLPLIQQLAMFFH